MEKSRDEIRSDILAEAREIHRRFEEARRELENDATWKKMQKWTAEAKSEAEE